MKIWITLLLCLPMVNVALAQQTKGGGSGVYNRDHSLISLRDLDASTCTLYSAANLMKQYQVSDKVEEILSALFEVHPYMAYQIRKEFDRQSWCVTTRLKLLNTEDTDNLNASNYLPLVQVGIRLIEEKKIFLDGDVLKKMPVDHRAMSLIHEVAHSFLDKNIGGRNDKLRALTKSIYLNNIAKKTNQSSLEERKANMEVVLKATGGLTAFGSVEFGKLFANAVARPESVTAAQLNRMLSLHPNGKALFDELVNDLGKAKFAAIVFSQFNPVFPLFYEITEIKNYAAVISEGALGKQSLDAVEQSVRFANDKLFEFGDAWKAKIGTCQIEKPESTVQFGSAGFMSAIGYQIQIQHGFALVQNGNVLSRYGINTTAKNKSYLVMIPSGPSLAEKTNQAFQGYEQKAQRVAEIFRSGRCDDTRAPGLKYFN